MRPPREDRATRAPSLPRSPAPIGQTPLERRRAYRYGGEIAVDRDVIYGRNAVAEALKAGRRKARRLLLAEGTEDRKVAGELAQLAAAHGVDVEHLSRTEIERRAPGVNHQGSVLEVGPYPYADYDAILAQTRDNPEALILVLDSVQDPQNLGTLLRTAEAADVTGVVIPEHRAVQVTPAVVSASAGAVEHLSIASVTNLVRAVEQAKEAGAWAVAAEAVPDAVPPAETDLTGPLVLVVGSEGHGVSRLLREACDLTVRIPLVGRVGSLNAATAGSILLYEVIRQRAEAATLSALVSSLEGAE
jgi:23S rRNA (guanosine2251-2'-O)-methyltransferase